MSKGKDGKVFAGISLALVDMYNVFKPSEIQLGNSVSLPLRTADGKTKNLPPSYDNLCVHFGLFQPIKDFKRQINEAGVGLVDWQEYAMTCYQKYEVLVEQHVKPIRQELEGHCYNDPSLWITRLWFYCLPRGEFFRKDPVTGELQYGWDPHSYVLTLLPTTVKSAEEVYHCPKEKLIVLASQVAWLTVSFCYRRQLTSNKKAREMLGDWQYFLQPKNIESLTMEKIKAALRGG